MLVDKKLIQRIERRDRSAFGELYRQSAGYTYSIVKRYVSSDNDHADVMQEVYARVFLKIDLFDARKGEFKHWLRRLAINQCVEHYRKQQKRINVVDIENVKDIYTEENLVLEGMSMAEIENILSKMPEGYRQVFMMIAMDEYSHKEVSTMLNISLQTVGSQLSRAKSWLRKNKTSFQQIKKLNQ